MKIHVLRSLNFGERVAEDEKDLSAYFVETSYWYEIFKGKKDIIYGAKGSGKSALYKVLLQKHAPLFNERRIIPIPAENIDGDPVFQRFESRLPKSEAGFQLLWKLYFLELIGEVLAERAGRVGLPGNTSQKLLRDLEKYGLIIKGKTFPLGDLLRRAIDLIAEIDIESIDAGGIEIEPDTQLPALKFPTIRLRKGGRKKKLPPVDELLKNVNACLKEQDLTVWVVIDRLDVAFASSDETERNALRALFRVYTNLSIHDRLVLKIFLRHDIWERITSGGYREATRIVRDTRLSWTPQFLFNLVLRRLLHNQSIRDMYKVEPAAVLTSDEMQRQLFYRVFPPYVEDGGKRHETFEWMLAFIRDGAGRVTPRELIHLISTAREVQLKRLSLGAKEPPEETLFDAESFKQSLYDVSAERLNKSLYAEYPQLRGLIQALERNRPRQSAAMLAKKWGISVEEAIKRAKTLVEVGAFEEVGTPDKPVFIVPKLFRPALHIPEQKKTPVSPSRTPEPAVNPVLVRPKNSAISPINQVIHPHVEAAKSSHPVEVESAASDDKGVWIHTEPPAVADDWIEIDGSAAPPIIPKSILLRLKSEDASERAASVRALARLDTDEAFHQICAAFDDPAQEVRDAAARALHDSSEDRAESFTRALRESEPERRRSIGASLASSGLAEEAVSQLTGESRERTYDAFSLLFLMAKAGETAPLIRAVESHPENEVRLAAVKLIALSGQQEVLPSFKRLAMRGSLPNEVRSAVMEAIYQISSSSSGQSL